MINEIEIIISKLHLLLAHHHGMLTCYTTKQEYVPYVRQAFISQNAFPVERYILIVVIVERLPKGAMVEWHAVRLL